MSGWAWLRTEATWAKVERRRRERAAIAKAEKRKNFRKP